MTKSANKQINDNAEFVTGTGSNSLSSFRGVVEARFKDINYIILSIILILLVMVATLIIDSFHVNSVTYREYSEKIETLNTLKNQNNQLIKQIKDNQEVIIKHQEQILESLNNK